MENKETQATTPVEVPAVKVDKLKKFTDFLKNNKKKLFGIGLAITSLFVSEDVQQLIVTGAQVVGIDVSGLGK